jgi:exonuclease III
MATPPELSPDLALLQEVIAVPRNIGKKYDIAMHRAAWRKPGESQRFSTAILVRGTIGAAIPLTAEWEWVNRELEHFKGNLLAHHVTVGAQPFRVMSVYSPAWPIDPERLREVDVEPVKLKLNPDVWVTELLWAALRGCSGSAEPSWIVGGDLNASETFDQRPSGPRGNREILDRMEALGFFECLRQAQGKLVPTFRNPSNGQIIHQMDHLFASKSMANQLISCDAGDKARVFGSSLSDHLPIVANFRVGHDAV